MSAILGRKIGMTQSFDSETGKLVPVTIVEAGPCRVVEAKTAEKDGYNAIVLGFDEVPGNKLKRKAQLGFFKKLSSPVYKVLREFRDLPFEAGAEIKVDQFNPGDSVTVIGVSRGKGWASHIKRWNFSRGRETHGGNFNRAHGSIGQKEFPGRVFKGKKMSGRMGCDQKTIKGIEVVGVIAEDNLLILKGPIPGGENGLLRILKTGAAKAA